MLTVHCEDKLALLLIDTLLSSYSSSTVSLQVASSTVTFFKGFLIEARDAGNLSLLAGGFFILTDPRRSQLLQCGQTQVEQELTNSS